MEHRRKYTKQYPRSLTNTVPRMLHQHRSSVPSDTHLALFHGACFPPSPSLVEALLNLAAAPPQLVREGLVLEHRKRRRVQEGALRHHHRPPVVAGCGAHESYREIGRGD